MEPDGKIGGHLDGFPDAGGAAASDLGADRASATHDVGAGVDCGAARLAPGARSDGRHGTTRWQVYGRRKKRRDRQLVLPESAAALPMFAEPVVESATAELPAATETSDPCGRCRDPHRRRSHEGLLRAADPGGGIGMPDPGGRLKVCVAVRPADFRKGVACRKGIGGLTLEVQEMSGLDLFCGAVFVFRAKRADHIEMERVIGPASPLCPRGCGERLSPSGSPLLG